MPTTLPPCPKCQSSYTYESEGLLICPECFYEWQVTIGEETEDHDAQLIRDANGNVLNNGDTVMVIKDLPVKGFPKPIKTGTKIKNIRLADGDHNLDCKIEGFGAMALKSEFVKKVS